MPLLDMEDGFWLLLPGVIGHVIFCLSVVDQKYLLMMLKSLAECSRTKGLIVFAQHVVLVSVHFNIGGLGELG